MPIDIPELENEFEEKQIIIVKNKKYVIVIAIIRGVEINYLRFILLPSLVEYLYCQCSKNKNKGYLQQGESV